MSTPSTPTLPYVELDPVSKNPDDDEVTHLDHFPFTVEAPLSDSLE